MLRVFVALALLTLLTFSAAPSGAQVYGGQGSGSSVSASDATAASKICKPRFVDGFSLEAELQSLKHPSLVNVLKVFSGFMYLDAFIIGCDDRGVERRQNDDRQPATDTQQPKKRKCISTPDGQKVCYTVRDENTIDVTYCDENGNCKNVTIRKNPDGTMIISNPNATIKMECSLDSAGRTHCRVAAVTVTGGGLTKFLYDDLIEMIESIKTKADPNSDTVEVCVDIEGDNVCYTVTPTEVEMCVTKPDGSTECTEDEHEDDVQDLIDWLD